MSDQGGTTGYSPSSQGGHPPVPNAMAHPPGPPIPPPYGFSPRPRGRGRGILVGAALVLAIALAAAALVVALVSPSRQSGTTSASTPTSAPTQPPSTEAADKALCEAVAPLMKEAIETKRGFVNLGDTGTPERDAGIPQFQAATRDWVGRAQSVLDEHAEPARYLTRMLQRYIDDTREYAASIRRGPESDGDAAAWNDSLIALGGPMEVCPTVGVQWW